MASPESPPSWSRRALLSSVAVGLPAVLGGCARLQDSMVVVRGDVPGEVRERCRRAARRTLDLVDGSLDERVQVAFAAPRSDTGDDAPAADTSTDAFTRAVRRGLEAKRAMPGRYDDDEARETFEDLAAELLRSLADEGLIGSASRDAFSPVEDAPSTDLDADAKTTASGTLAVEGDLHDGSGEKTAVIKAHTVSDTHEIGVHVLPEADFAFVVAVPIDDGRRMYADNSNPELGDVSTADSCSGDLCQKTCSGAPGAPFVIYSQSGGACANTCVDYSPPCSQCDNQDKCEDDSGW